MIREVQALLLRPGIAGEVAPPPPVVSLPMLQNKRKSPKKIRRVKVRKAVPQATVTFRAAKDLDAAVLMEKRAVRLQCLARKRAALVASRLRWKETVPEGPVLLLSLSVRSAPGLIAVVRSYSVRAVELYAKMRLQAEAVLLRVAAGFHLRASLAPRFWEQRHIVDCGAKVLQRIWRGSSERIALGVHRADKAVVVLQRAGRGAQARQSTRRRTQLQQICEAAPFGAITILSKTGPHHSLGFLHPDFSFALTRLQRIGGGKSARTLLSALHLNSKAVHIQRVWRGCLGRVRTGIPERRLFHKRGVPSPQGWLLMMLASHTKEGRGYIVSSMMGAAAGAKYCATALLKRVCYGFTARRGLAVRLHAVCTLQRIFRALPAREEQRVKRYSCGILQRWTRCSGAKLRAKQKCVERNGGTLSAEEHAVLQEAEYSATAIQMVMRINLSAKICAARREARTKAEYILHCTAISQELLYTRTTTSTETSLQETTERTDLANQYYLETRYRAHRDTSAHTIQQRYKGYKEDRRIREERHAAYKARLRKGVSYMVHLEGSVYPKLELLAVEAGLSGLAMLGGGGALRCLAEAQREEVAERSMACEAAVLQAYARAYVARRGVSKRLHLRTANHLYDTVEEEERRRQRLEAEDAQARGMCAHLMRGVGGKDVDRAAVVVQAAARGCIVCAFSLNFPGVGGGRVHPGVPVLGCSSHPI